MTTIGSTVLVTGASTGIGRATALRLAAAGWRVFAGVRRDADGRALADASAGSLTPVVLDVTDPAQIAAAADSIADAVGGAGLAGLVNNAGIARGGPVEYLPVDDWRLQFEVNLFGQVAVTQAMMPLLRDARGRIVFIGSNSGRISTPMMAPYGASKFAIEALAASMRLELRPWGMKVVVVEPGAVKTAIWEKGRALADELEAVMPADAASRYGDQIAAIRKGIETQDRTGIPADRVAAVVEKALTADRPRARYQVGIDSHVSAAASRVLPDRLLDVAVAKLAGP
ncbi:MAG: SDR family NAD(P)-dependent oxidoreductase [Acidimicrobiia bacterium]|nr:SDR family NAD(P)-dependent oxidoreductase [Acidimicrobiia bacterium]